MTTSIIIPVFNREKFVGRAIRSALANGKMSDIEIIVINDASTDHTLEVLDSFNNKIKIINNSKNLGLPSSLNVGIKKSTGKYIFRLDSDDYIHEKTIVTLRTILDLNNNIDGISCDYTIINDIQNVIETCSAESDPIGCGILFRREHIIELGLYDEEMKWHEDKEFFERYTKKYKLFNLPVSFYRYYKHGRNMTLNKNKSDQYLKKLEEKINEL